jgi:hypothetical protein
MVVLVVLMAAGVPVIVVVMRMVVVVVGVPMIMVVIVSVPVPVVMTVAVGLRAALGLHIGAAFGIERRLERDHAGAKTFDHRLDDGIAADAQRLWRYFSRQVAIAEVPGDAGQGQRVGGPDFRQRFGLGDHFNHAPVLEPQPVAAAQHCRFGEVEQEFEPADAGHGDAPAIACIEVEHDRIRRSARPIAGRNDCFSAQHHCLSGLDGPNIGRWGPLEPSLNETRSKRQPACKPGSVWPGLIAPT